MPNRPPRAVPPAPVSPRPTSQPLTTGYAVARASGARVIIGQPTDDCGYSWREKVIVLSPQVAAGTDLASLLIAAEEAAHHAQPRWIHALRWLGLVRLWEEADAFHRVKRFFARSHSPAR